MIQQNFLVVSAVGRSAGGELHRHSHKQHCNVASGTSICATEDCVVRNGHTKVSASSVCNTAAQCRAVESSQACYDNDPD